MMCKLLLAKKKILKILVLSITTSIFSACEKEYEFPIGFTSTATIIDNSPYGFFCYPDAGGLVLSFDQRLAGLERGYFSFNYIEEDWSVTADGIIFIKNASVSPSAIYDVIRPISIEEAETKNITDPDSCSVPSRFSLGSYVYSGYFDLSTILSVTNLMDMEKIATKINLVYDPARQTPDTLLLQLYYNPHIPEEWPGKSLDYGTLSCDLSSLATLEQWSDSLTVVVDAGDEEEHYIKISKNDFFKPQMKIK